MRYPSDRDSHPRRGSEIQDILACKRLRLLKEQQETTLNWRLGRVFKDSVHSRDRYAIQKSAKLARADEDAVMQHN